MPSGKYPWPDEDDFQEFRGKGWNRISVAYHSRKPYTPRIRADDLIMPSGSGTLRLLGMCAVMGVGMTLLYVWTTLFMLNFFVPLGGLVYAVALGSTAVALTALLYMLGTRETRRDRALATRL